MQLIQYRYASSFSTVITNEFIGEEFRLGQTFIDGYEAMGFVRNGIMPHLWGINLSHIYAREVR